MHASTSAAKSRHSSAAMRRRAIDGRRPSPDAPARRGAGRQTGASPSVGQRRRRAWRTANRKRSGARRPIMRTLRARRPRAASPARPRARAPSPQPAGSSSRGARRTRSPRPRTARSPRAFDTRTSRKICSAPSRRASSTKRRSRVAPEPFAARVRNHRQVEDLRFAGGEHQHAVRDDAALALADARAVARGDRVAEVARRPRRGVDLRLERRDVREVALAQRPPLGLGSGNMSAAAWPSSRA